jgi:hypothetical protein
MVHDFSSFLCAILLTSYNGAFFYDQNTAESRHSNFYTVVGLKFAALTKIFMGALETHARGTL